VKKFSISECEILLKSIVAINNEEDAKKFLEDVCTIKELQDMTQRITVAKFLSEGKSYQEISKETGASAATISRVSRCLNYGDGGYETILTAIGEKKV
jgi:TrpR-related protein YerC/YecD